LAAIPLVALYLYKKDGIFYATLFCVGLAVLSGAGVLPFCTEGFLRSVIFNPEQSVIVQVSFNFKSVEIYLPILAVLTVYLMAFGASFMNRDLFLNFIGIVFAVFLALEPPMPGWYIWIAAILAIFFGAQDSNKSITIYASLCVLYLIYFVFFHQKEFVDLYFLDVPCLFLKANNTTLGNVIFTLLSGTLLYIISMMYREGILSNTFYKRRNVPFTIGIAGDSGSGKSMLAALLEKTIGTENILSIEGDGDHRWERGDANWNQLTALNPKANYLYRQAENLKTLHAGKSIERIDYDHSTGRFTKAKKVSSKRYVILCGLHALYLAQVRKHLDLRIFMDTDEKLRRFWKLQRDTKFRGHTKAQVLANIENRVADFCHYIKPQKKHANFIIHYYDKNVTLDSDLEYSVNLQAKVTLPSIIDLESLVTRLSLQGIVFNHDYSENLVYQTINIDCSNKTSNFSVNELANLLIPQLDELTDFIQENDLSDTDKVIAILLLLTISHIMHEDS
jgi:uridine kinase